MGYDHFEVVITPTKEMDDYKTQKMIVRNSDKFVRDYNLIKVNSEQKVKIEDYKLLVTITGDHEDIGTSYVTSNSTIVEAIKKRDPSLIN